MHLLNLRLGCNDMDKARAFYDATFGAPGRPRSSGRREACT
jgi:catechol 2,3-dioxygenase-like lactoylglutathione lyase family enzyme